MEKYTVKNECSSEKAIVLEDMILTKDMPTTAGSKMLDGYMSLFDAEIVTKLKNAGFEISGKASISEFGFDLIGCADPEIVNEAMAVVGLDVNGTQRRAAAQNSFVNVKSTYGTVSRFGTIPVACSGECASVSAVSAENALQVLSAIIGHDDKDGTSLDEKTCASIFENNTKAGKIAVLNSFVEGLSPDAKEAFDKAVKSLSDSGIKVEFIDDAVICLSNKAWNVLMCAELCNNVSKYDGVKYGYRAKSFSNIDTLYTNSRTEAFGSLLKKAILFGSETLSTENYMKVYDKALRCRRVIAEAFAKLFENYDALLIPAVSTLDYSGKNEEFVFEENFYTAPASITGLPAVTVGNAQFIGKAFSEKSLLDLARLVEVK